MWKLSAGQGKDINANASTQTYKDTATETLFSFMKKLKYKIKRISAFVFLNSLRNATDFHLLSDSKHLALTCCGRISKMKLRTSRFIGIKIYNMIDLWGIQSSSEKILN